MRKFVIKTLLFILPLFAFIVFLVVFFYFKSLRVDTKMEKISKEYECILMGDSQMQRLKANLFISKTINLASSGEPYYFTYSKIKKLLKNKEISVKKIIPGCGVHNFGESYNALSDIALPGR